MIISKGLPADVLKLKEELSVIRNSDSYNRKVPDEIWEKATALCWTHAPSMVAKHLSLDYTKLKSKIVSKQKTEVTDFIEITSPGQDLEIECSGLRMKISGVSEAQVIRIAKALS